MSRVVSVWLPAWPIERLRRKTTQAIPGPLVLVQSGVHGLTISAADGAALALGIRVGTSLADARAVHGHLVVRPAEPGRDAAALRRLARWFGRYGPARNADGADGAWIDVTGVPHLFGGEEGLAADLIGRLAAASVTAQVGIADTLGAAHALARFAASAPAPSAIAVPGAAKAAIASLPVAALRLDPDLVRLLNRLGLRHVDTLFGLSRSALERRFRMSGPSRAGAVKADAFSALMRLDQALGTIREPLRPFFAQPDVSARLAFEDPLLTSEGLTTVVRELCTRVSQQLEALKLGARRFQLRLYRVDSSVAEIGVGTSAPSHNAHHVFHLIQEKLGTIDAGFGIDVVELGARNLNPLAAEQMALTPADRQARTNPALLIDRLLNRLGPDRLYGLSPHESHIPERGSVRTRPLSHTSRGPSKSHAPTASTGGPSWSGVSTLPAQTSSRPPLLLSPPEAIEVIAEVPEGAPHRLLWRRVLRRIVRAEGPERIAGEWWRLLPPGEAGGIGHRPATRDYYRLEDATGAGFWVFREGLWDSDEREEELLHSAPRWFMHGVFA